MGLAARAGRPDAAARPSAAQAPNDGKWKRRARSPGVLCSLSLRSQTLAMSRWSLDAWVDG